ncbi:MAG: hypothetical protein MZV65_37435 [Chromatiales bacterium]|nr:hypothetical protein [Chromatiales bacterium]
MQLPDDFTDDAGRALANREIFPLTVRTDDHPPLAKFPARFGIIEPQRRTGVAGHAAQPRGTARAAPCSRSAVPNAPSLVEKLRKSGEALFARSSEQQSVSGQVARVWKDAETEIVHWMQQLHKHQEQEGRRSLFADAGVRDARRIEPRQAAR